MQFFFYKWWNRPYRNRDNWSKIPTQIPKNEQDIQFIKIKYAMFAGISPA